MTLDSSRPVDSSLTLLHVLHDSETSSLLIVAKDGSTLKTFQVELSSMQSELVAEVRIGSAINAFTDSTATANYLILRAGSSKAQVLEARTLKVVKTLEPGALQTSHNDDIVVDQDGSPVSLVDLTSNDRRQLPVLGAGCRAKRQQTTENWGSPGAATSGSDGFSVAVSCEDRFSIITGDGQTLFESNRLNQHAIGGVKNFFRSGSDPSSFLVQFDDLSTHLVQQSKTMQGLQLQWSREEGLSEIKQLEVLHEASDKVQMAHSFDYVKHWKTAGGSPTLRLLQRYSENVNYMLKFLFSTEQITLAESASRKSDVDVYGFKKSIVALTNFGKITSFSSLNGEVLWSSQYQREAPVQILLRRQYLRDEESTETQVVSCFPNKLQFLSSTTGQVLYTQPLNMTASKFMVSSLKGLKSQVVIAVGRDTHGQTKV